MPFGEAVAMELRHQRHKHEAPRFGATNQAPEIVGGVGNVGIYTSAGVWNSILGTYSPSVPYWMADYLNSPSGPGTCADYQNWVNKGQHLPGPPQIVQYNSTQFDDDYAC